MDSFNVMEALSSLSIRPKRIDRPVAIRPLILPEFTGESPIEMRPLGRNDGPIDVFEDDDHPPPMEGDIEVYSILRRNV